MDLCISLSTLSGIHKHQLSAFLSMCIKIHDHELNNQDHWVEKRNQMNIFCLISNNNIGRYADLYIREWGGENPYSCC